MFFSVGLVSHQRRVASWSKVESCVYRSLQDQVHYEVAPVVRPHSFSRRVD